MTKEIWPSWLHLVIWFSDFSFPPFHLVWQNGDWSKIAWPVPESWWFWIARDIRLWKRRKSTCFHVIISKNNICCEDQKWKVSSLVSPFSPNDSADMIDLWFSEMESFLNWFSHMPIPRLSFAWNQWIADYYWYFLPQIMKYRVALFLSLFRSRCTRFSIFPLCFVFVFFHLSFFFITEP